MQEPDQPGGDAVAGEEPRSKWFAQKAWNQANPLARRAHSIVANAIRRGVLIAESCQVCGSPHAEAHHADYSKPLEVDWLCRLHHRHEHRRDKGGRA